MSQPLRGKVIIDVCVCLSVFLFNSGFIRRSMGLDAGQVEPNLQSCRTVGKIRSLIGWPPTLSKAYMQHRPENRFSRPWGPTRFRYPILIDSRIKYDKGVGGCDPTDWPITGHFLTRADEARRGYENWGGRGLVGQKNLAFWEQEQAYALVR